MKFRILKIYAILRNLFRVNHWRGHGIHSPFMYRFVREVIVKRKPGCSPNKLPEGILRHNLLKKDMLLARNIYEYLGYDRCIVAGEAPVQDRTLCLAPSDISTEIIEQALLQAEDLECCVTILGVNKSHEKYKLCRRVMREKRCVGVDIYRTYIFFFDNRLQKQNYRLRNKWL